MFATGHTRVPVCATVCMCVCARACAYLVQIWAKNSEAAAAGRQKTGKTLSAKPSIRYASSTVFSKSQQLPCPTLP